MNIVISRYSVHLPLVCPSWKRASCSVDHPKVPFPPIKGTGKAVVACPVLHSILDTLLGLLYFENIQNAMRGGRREDGSVLEEQMQLLGWCEMKIISDVTERRDEEIKGGREREREVRGKTQTKRKAD